jgi:acyl dehydratase
VNVQAGSALPEFRVESVSPDKLQIFAAVARDANPIHYDRAEVQRLGMGDKLINEGPINLGFVVNMLEAWAGTGCIRELTTRYTAPVHEGDAVTARGTVTGVREVDGARVAECEVWLEKADGTRAVAGTALVALP